MIEFALSYGEMSLATHVACARNAAHLRRNTPPKYGAADNNSTWAVNIIGCFGELAVAKYLNLYWPGGEWHNVGQKDVGGLVQVRSRDPATGRDLVLHESDDDDDPFVLTYIDRDKVALVGWVHARDGKQSKYWADPGNVRPVYFVPWQILRPMPDLKAWVHDRVEFNSDGVNDHAETCHA